jgi:hypothetical protein
MNPTVGPGLGRKSPLISLRSGFDPLKSQTRRTSDIVSGFHAGPQRGRPVRKKDKMISSVYQSSLYTSAYSGNVNDVVSVPEFVLVMLPTKATFSAQASLSMQVFAPVGDFPLSRTSAYIERYITYGPGGSLQATYLGDIPGGNVASNIRNGYAVQFAVIADAANAVVEANATATVFIES